MRSLVAAGLLLFLALPTAAAGGWYLLLPPLMTKKNATQDDPEFYRLGTDAPFSMWYRKGAFDSAKECMAARVNLIREEKASVANIVRLGDEASKKLGRIIQVNAEAAECIASDDRRLTQ